MEDGGRMREKTRIERIMNDYFSGLNTQWRY